MSEGQLVTPTAEGIADDLKAQPLEGEFTPLVSMMKNLCRVGYSAVALMVVGVRAVSGLEGVPRRQDPDIYRVELSRWSKPVSCSAFARVNLLELQRSVAVRGLRACPLQAPRGRWAPDVVQHPETATKA